MSDAAPLYAQTLSLLRSASARHAGLLKAMTGASPAPGRVPGSFEQVERLAGRAREIEDEAIGAICRLSTFADRATAVRAVDEADASWVLDVILNRAAETTIAR